MRTTRTAGVSREVEVRYRVDPNIWDLPQYQSIPLSKLIPDYLLWMATRTEHGGPATPASIKACRDTLNSYRKAVVTDGEPDVLASLCARNYDSWIRHLRAADLPYDPIRLANGRLMPHPRDKHRQPMSDAKISQHTSCLKAFSNLYVFKTMGYTRSDLLQQVAQYRARPNRGASPQWSEAREYSEAEAAALMGCHDVSTELGKRNRALVAVIVAGGLRITAAGELPYADYNPYTGQVDTIDKRNRRLFTLKGAARDALHDYLRVRPETDCSALFVQLNGQPLTPHGIRSLWRKVAADSGVKKGAHIARRTLTKRALRAGEDPTTVQKMLGWQSPAMVLRYADEVALEVAAAKLPDYSPV